MIKSAFDSFGLSLRGVEEAASDLNGQISGGIIKIIYCAGASSYSGFVLLSVAGTGFWNVSVLHICHK
jgi:hypothetical protein